MTLEIITNKVPGDISNSTGNRAEDNHEHRSGLNEHFSDRDEEGRMQGMRYEARTRREDDVKGKRRGEVDEE